MYLNSYLAGICEGEMEGKVTCRDCSEGEFDVPYVNSLMEIDRV